MFGLFVSFLVVVHTFAKLTFYSCFYTQFRHMKYINISVHEYCTFTRIPGKIEAFINLEL